MSRLEDIGATMLPLSQLLPANPLASGMGMGRILSREGYAETLNRKEYHAACRGLPYMLRRGHCDDPLA